MNGINPVLMADFKITSLLSGIISFMQDIGGYIVIIAGILLLIVGVVQIAKGLASGGKGQTNWVVSIGCLVFGGALMFGGWNLISSLSKAGGGALQEMNDAGSNAGAGADWKAENRKGAEDWSQGKSGGNTNKGTNP
jgi:hypothetical protein